MHVPQASGGGPCSAALWLQLQPYVYGLVNEMRVEGEHRDLAQERQRAHATQLPFGTATVRLRQHRELVAATRETDAGRRALESAWRGWKVLAVPPEMALPARRFGRPYVLPRAVQS